MTIDERKMAIAYADLLQMQELVQHILRMDAEELFGKDARKAFALVDFNLNKVMVDVGRYMSEHTELNKPGEKGEQP